MPNCLLHRPSPPFLFQPLQNYQWPSWSLLYCCGQWLAGCLELGSWSNICSNTSHTVPWIQLNRFLIGLRQSPSYLKISLPVFLITFLWVFSSKWAHEEWWIGGEIKVSLGYLAKLFISYINIAHCVHWKIAFCSLTHEYCGGVAGGMLVLAPLTSH